MSDGLEQLENALAGRYSLESELRAGGMATVYLAEDLKHDRKAFAERLNYFGWYWEMHFEPDLKMLRGYEPFDELMRPKG